MIETLDQLIDELLIIRQEYGGSIKIIHSDHKYGTEIINCVYLEDGFETKTEKHIKIVIIGDKI